MESAIFDLGTGSIKIGLSSSVEMKGEIPSVLGRMEGDESKIDDFKVGREAISGRRDFVLKRPIEHGIVTDWKDMELLWDFSYKSISKTPESGPLIVTEPFLNPKENREKMVSLAFERFECPAFYVSISSAASSFGAGKMTSIITETGFGVTLISPLWEGYVLPHAMLRSNMGGEQVTLELMRSILKEHQLERKLDFHVVNEIKEKLSCTSLDYYSEHEKLREGPGKKEEFTLPDGHSMEIEKFSLIRSAEVMFNPALIGSENPGIHELAYNCVEKCDVDIRQDLYHNIILSGGGTLMNGFMTRFEKEITGLVTRSDRMFLRIIGLKERKHLAWKGAWVVSNLSSFKNMCVRRKEFEDVGPNIVHRKCF